MSAGQRKGGLAFLSKKKWATGNMENRKRVEEAEEKERKEKAKIEELMKERAEQRRQEELKQLQIQNGLRPAEERMDWMVMNNQTMIQQQQEQHLLGKEIRFDNAPKLEQPLATTNGPGSWGDKVPLNTRDIAQHVRHDPMTLIARDEVTRRAAILSDPKKMKTIMETVAMMQEMREKLGVQSQPSTSDEMSISKSGKKEKKDKKDKKDKKSKKDKKDKKEKSRHRDKKDRRRSYSRSPSSGRSRSRSWSRSGSESDSYDNISPSPSRERSPKRGKWDGKRDRNSSESERSRSYESERRDQSPMVDEYRRHDGDQMMNKTNNINDRDSYVKREKDDSEKIHEEGRGERGDAKSQGERGRERDRQRNKVTDGLGSDPLRSREDRYVKERSGRSRSRSRERRSWRDEEKYRDTSKERRGSEDRNRYHDRDRERDGYRSSYKANYNEGAHGRDGAHEGKRERSRSRDRYHERRHQGRSRSRERDRDYAMQSRSDYERGDRKDGGKEKERVGGYSERIRNGHDTNKREGDKERESERDRERERERERDREKAREEERQRMGSDKIESNAAKGNEPKKEWGLIQGSRPVSKSLTTTSSRSLPSSTPAPTVTPASTTPKVPLSALTAEEKAARLAQMLQDGEREGELARARMHAAQVARDREHAEFLGRTESAASTEFIRDMHKHLYEGTSHESRLKETKYVNRGDRDV